MSRILADAKPAPPRVGCVLLRCRLGARGRDLPAQVLGDGHEGLTLVTPAERRELELAFAVIAGRLLDPAVDSAGASSPTPAVHGSPVAGSAASAAVFFVDPSEAFGRFGGADAWAKSIKGYLSARGYGASVAVAATREQALAAARSRWGTVVVHDGAGSVPPPARPGFGSPAVRNPVHAGGFGASRTTSGAVAPDDPRFITAVGVRAPSVPGGVRAPHAPAIQLASPGDAARQARGGQLALPGLRLGKPKRASRS